jgi:hypothetical protein
MMDAKTAKALREAATPGPYVAYPVRHDERDGDWCVESTAPGDVLARAGRDRYDDCIAAGIRRGADARLFASALLLAEAVERLEAEVEEWRRRALAAEAAHPVDTAPTCG